MTSKLSDWPSSSMSARKKDGNPPAGLADQDGGSICKFDRLHPPSKVLLISLQRYKQYMG